MYTDVVFQDDTLTLTAWPTPESPGPCIANGTLHLRMHPKKGIACNTDTSTFDGRDTFQFTNIRDIDPGGDSLQEGCTSLCLATGVYKTHFSRLASSSQMLKIDLVALRNDSHCCMQTIQAVSGGRSLEHFVRAPAGSVLERAYMVIRYIHGKSVPCLVVEATLSGYKTVYSCAYWSDGGATFAGVETRSSTDPKVGSVIHVPDNATVYMLHSIVQAGETSVEVSESILAFHFRHVDTSSVQSRLRSAHILQWSKLWGVGLSIQGSHTSNPDKIRRMNIHLASSAYRLLCSLKTPYDTTRSLVSSDNMHVTDYNDHPLTVACTLMLVPWASWSFSLPQVSCWAPLHTLASSITDTLAMYRVTLDRTKLELRWSNVRSIVDYIVSRIDPDRGVGFARTLSGENIANDTYTTGMVRRALDAAEQICNTLRTPVDPSWSELRGSLTVTRQTDFTLALAETPPGADDGLALLHPATLPTYAHLTDLGQHAALLEDNRTSLEASARAYPPSATTYGSIACLSAMAVGSASATEAHAKMDECFDLLLSASDHFMDMLWGATCSPSTHSATELLVTVGYGFTGLRIQGHTGRDGVHIIPNALVPGPRTSILPTTWSVVRRFSSVGPRTCMEHMTQNSLHP